MWVNIQRITGVPHCANVVWPDLVHSQVHFVAYYFLPQIPNLRAFWLSLGTEEIILTKH